jgi:lactoylglutathione lyase
VSEVADRYAIHPPKMRWTHIALPSSDIDKSIEWYQRFTPLELLDRREDADGYGAWLGHRDQVDTPFILVLVSFFHDQDKGPQPIMAPFAHIGIEVTSRAGRSRRPRRGEVESCLAWPPTEMPPPIGYICALKDPDGNMIEFSYDQGVYATVQQVWGS